MKYEIVPPSPSAMIESMRAYGYSHPMAIADLIDNSISANASKVWLNFHWDGPESWISIADNGDGMSEELLVAAMRLGSKSPLHERESSDLGRFGLGMKTASFSQCRNLIVKTKKCGVEALRRWDLDFIAENAANGDDRWLLLCTGAGESREAYVPLEHLNSGTVVYWGKLDRITGNAPVSDANAQRMFHHSISAVKEYLAMVFHRYLEGVKPRLKIYINGDEPDNCIDPWGPFLDKHPCTNSSPIDHISIHGGKVLVKGYVLPHKNKLSKQEHIDAAGPKGWNAQQGFYVYRNDRLLVAGSWLGLGQTKPWTQEEHYKLARISVEIPNSMDKEWQLDVKKTVAIPPPLVRERLLGLAMDIRRTARHVFAHKGQYGPHAPRKQMERPWICSTLNGSPVYRLDRKHPLVREAVRLAGSHKEVIESLLDVIEETVPVQQIWLDTAEKPDHHTSPFANRTRKDISRIINLSYESLLSAGYSSEDAMNNLICREEFADYRDLIQSVREE